MGCLGLVRFTLDMFASLLIITIDGGAFAVTVVRTFVAAAGNRVALLSCRRSALVGEFLQFSWAEASHTGGFLFEGNSDGRGDAWVVQGVQEVKLSGMGGR